MSSGTAHFEIRPELSPVSRPKFPFPEQIGRRAVFFSGTHCAILRREGLPETHNDRHNGAKHRIPLRDGDSNSPSCRRPGFFWCECWCFLVLCALLLVVLYKQIIIAFFRQSRPECADRSGAPDRNHPVVPPGGPAVSRSRAWVNNFPDCRIPASAVDRHHQRCWRRWRRFSAARRTGRMSISQQTMRHLFGFDRDPARRGP